MLVLIHWLDGLYFKIYGPFVHTKWNLNAARMWHYWSRNFGYFQGYFSSVDVESSNLNNGFLAYANGEYPTIPNNYDSYGEYECQAGVPPFHGSMHTTWRHHLELTLLQQNQP